jgi:hypothetical protein
MSKLHSETPDQQKPKPSQKNLTPNEAALGDLLKMLQPLVEFHREVEDAGGDDLRIFWDVRVIRGASDICMTSSGSSSLPGALSDKLRPNAASAIQQEVVDKIAIPLVGKMQALVESGALDTATRARKDKPTLGEPKQLAAGELVDIANEYDDQP